MIGKPHVARRRASQFQHKSRRDPEDLAESLSFALRFEGRKSQHDSDRLNADIVAKRLVRYLNKAGYVVMKKPPLGGHDQVARGFGQR